MSELHHVSNEEPQQLKLLELARLANLFAVSGLSRVPLLELSKVLQLENVKLSTLTLTEQQRAELPFLSRLALLEICRRFELG